MTLQLKGGHTTEDPRLDRIYQLDLRSLNYQVEPYPSVVPRSYTWKVGTWLDQGQEGSCVGHGFAHELIAVPKAVVGVDSQYARHQIYWEAQKIDDWPGGSYPGASPSYEGTSVLSGAKVVASLGFYSEYRWAINTYDLAAYIGHHGPAVLGVAWYEGMWNTDAEGFIAPIGQAVGGHCILARSVRLKKSDGYPAHEWREVDLDKSFFVLWNSWGPNWGVQGYAKVTLRSMVKLIEQDHGEACCPIRTSKRVI